MRQWPCQSTRSAVPRNLHAGRQSTTSLSQYSLRHSLDYDFMTTTQRPSTPSLSLISPASDREESHPSSATSPSPPLVTPDTRRLRASHCLVGDPAWHANCEYATRSTVHVCGRALSRSRSSRAFPANDPSCAFGHPLLVWLGLESNSGGRLGGLVSRSTRKKFEVRSADATDLSHWPLVEVGEKPRSENERKSLACVDWDGYDNTRIPSRAMVLGVSRGGGRGAGVGFVEGFCISSCLYTSGN
jgi:hypothetical protein